MITDSALVVNVRKLWIVGFLLKIIMNGSFLSAVIAAYPLLLPGAARAFTKFKWFTFSLTLTFVFCQSVHLNVRRHPDMLPGAKVKEFEIHYKLKLWASFSQSRRNLTIELNANGQNFTIYRLEKLCWAEEMLWITKKQKTKRDIVSLYFASPLKTFRFALVSYCSSSGTQEVIT